MSFFDDDKKLENTEDEQYEEEIVNEEELDDDEYEYVEVDEDEELEDGYEYVEVDENGNEIVSEQTNQPSPEVTEENTDASKKIDDDLNPPQLANIQLEYAYLGLLFNNPKGISVYYFTYDECFFSTDALENLYKIILFQDGEKYAPPQAKDKFNLPLEDAQTYEDRKSVV